MSGERVIAERIAALRKHARATDAAVSATAKRVALIRIENRAVELDPSYGPEDRPLFAWAWRAAILEELQRWQPAPDAED